MKVRDPNFVDFLKAIGCFCIIWYHSSYYWKLNINEREIIDTAKYFFVSWSMPFFYISTFYFLLKNGGDKHIRARVYAKVPKIFLIQFVVILTYAIYKSFNSLVLQDKEIHSLFLELKSCVSLGYFIDVFMSGNSTPAYFLAQLFFLYLPITFLGKAISNNIYLSILSIMLLMFTYYRKLENPIITIESYFYLSVSIFLIVIHDRISTENNRRRLFLIISVVFIAVWRIYENEFLMTGIAFGLIFKILFHQKGSRILAAKISQFGYFYSLYIFLFHTLFFWLVETTVSFLVNYFNFLSVNRMLLFIVINLGTFAITAVSAMILHRRFGKILQI